jgi:hypothetical protein
MRIHLTNYCPINCLKAGVIVNFRRRHAIHPSKIFKHHFSPDIYIAKNRRPQDCVPPAALPKSQSQKIAQRPRKEAGAPIRPPRKLSEGKRVSKHEDQFAVSATMSSQFRKENTFNTSHEMNPKVFFLEIHRIVPYFIN